MFILCAYKKYKRYYHNMPMPIIASDKDKCSQSQSVISNRRVLAGLLFNKFIFLIYFSIT